MAVATRFKIRKKNILAAHIRMTEGLLDGDVGLQIHEDPKLVGVGPLWKLESLPEHVQHVEEDRVRGGQGCPEKKRAGRRAGR